MNRRTRLILIFIGVLVLLVGPAAAIALRADSGKAAFGDIERIGRNRVSAATVEIALTSPQKALSAWRNTANT